MFRVDGARRATGGLKCFAACLLALASPRRSSSAAGISAGVGIRQQPTRRLTCLTSDSSLLCSRYRVGGYVRSGNVLEGLGRVRRRTATPTDRVRLHHRRHGGGVDPTANFSSRTQGGANATAKQKKPRAKEKEKKQNANKTSTPSSRTGSPTPPPRFRSRLRRASNRDGRPSADGAPGGVTVKAGPRRRGAVSDASRTPAASGNFAGGGARGLFFRRKETIAASTAASAATPPRRPHRRRLRHRQTASGRRTSRRDVAVAGRPRGVPRLVQRVWRTLVLLDGCCEATWVGKASAHVLAGALASSHSAMASLVVGLALWVSCAKRLTGRIEHDWKQVARITIEVALLWYCHALPHGLGAGRPLRGNFGTGKAGDLLGAMWHFLGQGAFIRLVAASGRLVNLNVLEANGVLLGLSHLGNVVAGSRMRRITGAAAAAVGQAHSYQLRGFFSRTNGIFREIPFLSLPFDSADVFLALQGILSATEREVVHKNGELALAFRDFASQSGNTLDAHSLGAVGARNLMGMGFITARVRMFGRPALSLGWTEKANNMCMFGDPICGSLLQKLLDPTCVMLKGRGHVFDAYVACAG
ncbi:unnamed protein product [Scytosiphon promiscuus]